MSTPTPLPLDFGPQDTLTAMLQKRAGTRVELVLRSGQKIGGKIEFVGQFAVHLEQLASMEFFDAIVQLDEIAAVVIRAR
jgi:hypothetical protein